jgi:hypothetical protein
LLVALGMTQADGAQGMEIVMHEAKDLIIAFPRIAKQFADLLFWLWTHTKVKEQSRLSC